MTVELICNRPHSSTLTPRLDKTSRFVSVGISWEGKGVGTVISCSSFNNNKCYKFSPLGKVAGRAIYFTNVFSLFFYFFSGHPQSPAGSEANGPIFTKISRLVDR